MWTCLSEKPLIVPRIIFPMFKYENHVSRSVILNYFLKKATQKNFRYFDVEFESSPATSCFELSVCPWTCFELFFRDINHTLNCKRNIYIDCFVIFIILLLSNLSNLEVFCFECEEDDKRYDMSIFFL